MTTTERSEDGQHQTRRIAMEGPFHAGMIGGVHAQPRTSAKPIVERFFAQVPSQIEITEEAINASICAVQDIMRRLGIPTMYGCVEVGGEDREPQGDLDITITALQQVQDRARTLRGLCETLEARL